MKSILVAALALVLLTLSVSAQNPGASAIEHYLKDPSTADYQEAVAALDAVRTITLKYEQPGVKESNQLLNEMAGRIRANSVITVASCNPDGTRLPGRIVVSFSKLYRYPGTLKASDWLAEMRKPMEKGWTLQSIDIIKPPSMEQKKHIYALSEQFIEAVYRRLEARKDDFPQLRTLTPTAKRPGEWIEEGPWPRFPSIEYRQEAKPHRPSKPASKDWCLLDVTFLPMAGEFYANDVSGHRSYALMACNADWNIRTANARETTTKYAADPFLHFVDQSIRESLTELDAYEASLKTGSAPNP